MTIFTGLCLGSIFSFSLYRVLKNSDERDKQRAEVVALEQRAQFRVIPGGPRRTESWAVITYRESS